MRREWKWVGGTAGGTFLLLLWLFGFFRFGSMIPLSGDINPSSLGVLRFTFPPQAMFAVNYWLGLPEWTVNFTPLSLLAWLPDWIFFTAYYPLCALAAFVLFYRWLRDLGLGLAAGLFGALAYAWQGPLAGNIYAGHINPALVYALLPLAVFLARRAALRTSLFFSAAAGAATGMLVALVPDRGMICSLLVAAVYLFSRGWNRGAGLGIARDFARLILLVAVAFAVAWPTLQASVETSIEGVSMGGKEDPDARYDWATQWSLTPEDLLNYVVPGFYGWHIGSEEGVYWGRIGRSEGWETTQQGFRNFAQEHVGFGTLPFLLALLGGIGVWRRMDGGRRDTSDWARWGRFFSVAGLVFWLLALGKYTPLHLAFYKLPYMDTWRNPIKFMLVGNFCWILLSACGLHLVLRRLERMEGTELAWTVSFWRIACWILGLLLVGCFLFGPLLSVQLAGQGFSSAQAGSIQSTLRAALLAAFLSCGLVTYGSRLLSGKKPMEGSALTNPWLGAWWDRAFLPENRPKEIAGLFCALLILQMAWVQSHFVVFYDYRAAFASNAFLERIRSAGEPIRVKVFNQDPLLHRYLSTVFPYHGISSVDIPAVSRVPNDYEAFFKAMKEDSWQLWKIAGVRYVAMGGQQFQQMEQSALFREKVGRVIFYRARVGSFDRVDLQEADGAKGFSHALAEVKDYLPKITPVSGWKAAPTLEEALQQIASPDFDPRQSLIVAQADLPPTMKPSYAEAEKVRIKIQEYGNHRIVFQVQAPEEALLLINDRFDPKWQVRINGQPAALFRADFILRGLAVPAGDSRVELVYASNPLPVYISMAVWPVLLAWGFGVRRRRLETEPQPAG
jgi:hypothetical protein